MGWLLCWLYLAAPEGIAETEVPSGGTVVAAPATPTTPGTPEVEGAGEPPHEGVGHRETDSNAAETGATEPSAAEPSAARPDAAADNTAEADPTFCPLPEGVVLVEPGTPTVAPEEPVRRRYTWVSASLHASLFGDVIDRSTLQIRAGYAIMAGVRFGKWGVFGQFDHDLWGDTELDLGVSRGVVSFALGLDYLYFDERVRASIAFGAAVLLTSDVAFHDRGQTGVFFEIRPAGVRWSISDHWWVQLDPASFAVVAPIVSTPSLVDMEYRATLTFEWNS